MNVGEKLLGGEILFSHSYAYLFNLLLKNT